MLHRYIWQRLLKLGTAVAISVYFKGVTVGMTPPEKNKIISLRKLQVTWNTYYRSIEIYFSTSWSAIKQKKYCVI